MPEDPDDTIKVSPPSASVLPPSPSAVAASHNGEAKPARSAGRGLKIAGVVACVMAGAGGAGWFLLGASPVEQPIAAAAPPVPPSPALQVPNSASGEVRMASTAVVPDAPVQRSIAARAIVPLLDEEAILEHSAAVPVMFRLRENPRVFILDFPDLDQQGDAMNRLAALVEKVGQPRDRLLDDAALARAIAEAGDTPATYYYGHNYRGSDVGRFFALAWRDNIRLTRGELWLQTQFEIAREIVGSQDDFAILSIPTIERRVDASMRRAILHHEIGHGHFFTRPRFAEHVSRVWHEMMTEAERASFRRFLSSEGYDPGLEEVMINETMAFVAFTPDRRFFNASMVGLDEARVRQLREAFRAGF